MYCEHCGAAINAEAQFCSACGGKIQASGISQPTAQRDFASDRRRGSSQSLQTIILISIPVLLLIVAGFWFTSGSLPAAKTAVAPNCAANATRYQVIHKLAAPVLGLTTILESEAAWKKIEEDATSRGFEVRHHDGTMSFSMKSTKETIRFYLSDLRVQSHDEKLGSWQCEASFIAEEKGKAPEMFRLPVTYRSELADEGRSHYVSVADSPTRPGSVGKKNASAAPDDVTRSAIMSVKDVFRSGGGMLWSLDHVSITKIGPSPLTGADRANGITEKWCVLVNFAARLNTQPWEDRHNAILVVRDQHGLKPRLLPNYGDGESAATDNFVRCLSGDIVL